VCKTAVKQLLSDGTSQSVDIPNPDCDGGITFAGFTDADKAIAGITINVYVDIIAMDDVRYVTDPVSEPASLALLGLHSSDWVLPIDAVHWLFESP
jgi:hypothetical protein